MNKQEIFDTVAKHLFTQGERAVNDDGLCCYRVQLGDKVLKCAVGALIPDEMYREEMDGFGAAKGKVWSCNLDGIVRRATSGEFALPQYIIDNLELLTDLQQVHDWAALYTDESMKRELKRVGLKHCLDVSVLKGLSFNKPEVQNDAWA